MNKYNKNSALDTIAVQRREKRCPLPPKPCTLRFWKAENTGPVDIPIEWWKRGSGSLVRDNVSVAPKTEKRRENVRRKWWMGGVGNGSLEVATSALRHKQEKGRQRLKAYELEGITL